MATAREELEVRAQLRDDFSRNLKRMRGNIRNFSRRGLQSFKQITGSVLNLKAALAGVAAALAIRQFARLIMDTADTVDSIGKLSEQLGLTTEFLSQIEFASKRSGVAFNVVTTAIQRLTRRAAEFRQTGGGAAAEGFRILGEDITGAVKAGASMEELFPKLADRFSELEDPQQRVLAAFKLFDSEGVRVLRLLNREYRGLIRTADRFGLTVTRGQAEAAAAFADARTDFESTVRGLKRAVVTELLPVFTNALKELTKYIHDNREDILDFFSSAIPSAFKKVETAGLAVQLSFTKIKQALLDFQSFFARGVGGGQSLLGLPLGDVLGVPGFSAEDVEALNREIESTERTRLLLEEKIKQIRDLGNEVRRAEREQKLKETDERYRTGQSFYEARTRRRLGVPFPGLPGPREIERANKALKETVKNLDAIDKRFEFEKRTKPAFPAEVRRGLELGNRALREEARETADILEQLRQKAAPLPTDIIRLPTVTSPIGEDFKEIQQTISRSTVEANQELEQQILILQALDAHWAHLNDPVAGALDGIRSIAEENAQFNIMSGSIRDLGFSFERNLTDSLIRFADVTNDAKFTFRDFSNSIIKDIQRIAAEMISRQLIGSAFQAVGSAVGAFAGSTTNVGTPKVDLGGGAGLQPIVSRQHGGVLTGESPQLLLAHPPEAVVPLPDGRSIPVQLQGGRGQGGGMTVVQNFNISAVDAKSFDERWLDTAGRRAREAAEIQADEFRRNPAVLGSFQQ